MCLHYVPIPFAWNEDNREKMKFSGFSHSLSIEKTQTFENVFLRKNQIEVDYYTKLV
jgi:hypothetical protein